LEKPCSSSEGLSRREFLQQSGFSVASVALTGLTWSALSAEGVEARALEAPKRKPLVVKPVFTYETPTRRPQTSWRSWGGIETEGQAREELAHIQAELAKLKGEADFPIEFLPLSSGKTAADLGKIADAGKADLILVYAAGGTDPNLFAPLVQKGKDLIYFLRHTSGPLSFWYEAFSPWYLRGNRSDRVIAKEIDADDVVVDSLVELTWRLRALCGLKNARGTKIVAIGGAIGWGAAYKTAPGLAREKWKIDIQEVTYNDLGKLMKAAFDDAAQVRRARHRAAEYLKDPGVKLEIDRKAVEKAFLLEHVFRLLMAQAGGQAITIAGCMATVMPIAQTSACLALSTLNDAGSWLSAKAISW
jgi:hypothetical protein